MTPQQLKNSILQLAIQGKLVEQRPEEGTAKELLQEISAEKGRLIREGKIKKAKPLPEISEDEIPFEVPESWEWVRLGDIVYNQGQEKPIEPFAYIDIGSIDNTKQCLSEKENIILPENAPSRARKKVKKGDIIYATVRPYLHNMCIIDREFSREPIASTGFAVMTTHVGVNNRYLFFYLLAPTFDAYVNSNENSKGVAYPAINDKALYSAIIPLPPLAEQHRIVSKIEELLPYIDQYEKAYTKLTAWNKKFPEAIRQSILQYAMEGKLVEQRPEEGTAEELLREIRAEKARLVKEGKIKKTKPLPEISEDEIPFEVPESWMWVRLGDILSSLTDGTHKTPKYTVSGIPFISVKNISSRFLSFENTKFISAREHEELIKRCHPEKGDILLSKVGTTGIPVIIASEQEFSIFVSIALLKFSSHMYAPYLLRAIESPNVQEQCKTHTRGVGNKNWVLNDIANTILPLPPLAEQKRIVTRIEELLFHCNAL